mgnify:CR=1 FL=1
MSVICDSGILKLISEGLIDFDRSETDYASVLRQVNPNTLDLSLGGYYRRPKTNEAPFVFGVAHQTEDYWDLIEMDRDDGVLLNPGDIFLGCSREYLCIPKDVCAQVFTKSSLGRVFINHMMAGVIDAGFEGTITLEFKNEGKHSIMIPYGARVVQLQFNRLEGIPDRDYSMRKNRYQGQVMPEPARAEQPDMDLRAGVGRLFQDKTEIPRDGKTA